MLWELHQVLQVKWELLLSDKCDFILALFGVAFEHTVAEENKWNTRYKWKQQIYSSDHSKKEGSEEEWLKRRNKTKPDGKK